MHPPMHPNAERVRTELKARGADGEVVELAAHLGAPAAGTPHAVFRTTPEELARVTGGEAVDVREETRNASWPGHRELSGLH